MTFNDAAHMLNTLASYHRPLDAREFKLAKGCAERLSATNGQPMITLRPRTEALRARLIAGGSN